MSELASFSNIKIPYPIEGVIRTAQLDDTIAPQDSVQLAVNMNFDRVGATQTRLGVETYADQLVDAINSFGTLRNSLVPDGYERIAQLGDWHAISAPFADPSAVKISSTRVVIFWQGTDNDGFGRIFSVDQDNGDIEALGSAVEFETDSNSGNRAILVSSSIVMNLWTGPGNDGWARCFLCATDTLTPGTAYEFDSSHGEDISVAQVDSTHFIVFYTSASDQGVATILAVNTGTLEITEPGSPTTFEAGVNFDNSCIPLGNGTHFVNTWNGSAARTQAFSVNTGTWAITAIGSPLNYDAVGGSPVTLSCNDGEHFILLYIGSGGMTAQALEVNTGTYAITEVGTPIIFNATSGNDLFGVSMGDGEHFVAFYSKNVGDGYVQMLEMDPVTFDMSLVGTRLSGYSFANGGYGNAILLDPYRILTVWGTEDRAEGLGTMFKTLGEIVNGRWLYAGHADEVSNWDGSTWTVRRSGLVQVAKPRYAQYLNYIWMVNGNASLGGDPVATSNGGNFGSDLVPEEFPPGDFINGGFEGRVWVADKTMGIIYYSDIVQFTPPDVYELTYNPDVNYITTISPQTGEQFTALYEVPRALLVFTENTITRIYGATSIDAYPAYNVGTFSQESIIETKTGIFFHHSSGFYQFDYGSQPVEISRRIIDFVRAIPRSYYDDVTGVYDGFDAIEWSVGPLSVDGIAYANCVVRYTISTQVWTIYDYVGNTINAMIFYDDGVNLNHLMGTADGKTGAMDKGYTDFGQPFYYEFITRWSAYTEMYCFIKNISGFNVYSENAGGANLYYQVQKSGPNAWVPIGTITEQNNALMPNSGTEDFDVLRLRIAGTTSGVPVVIHGIEVTELIVKGFNEN